MTTTTEIKPRSAKQLALKAAKDAALVARYNKQLTGPLQIGDRAICGYWQAAYTLIAINEPEGIHSHPTITVRWDAQPNRPMHETTHATCWDDRRDVALTGENANASVKDYRALVMAKRIAAYRVSHGVTQFSQPEVAQ